MGALAPWHWAVIIVVVFLLFGGRLLPKLGKSLGNSITGLRDGLKEGSEGFKAAVAEDPNKEPKKVEKEPVGINPPENPA
jgi:sec-independent protein translocase protein TatA